MNCFKLLTFSKLLWVFSLICNPASAQPVRWDSSTSYYKGDIVIVGTSSYFAAQSVPINTTPPNPTYWTDLEVASMALYAPVERVPSIFPPDSTGPPEDHSTNMWEDSYVLTHGWKEITWFGSFFASSSSSSSSSPNWIYHQHLGWVSPWLSNSNSTWLYSFDLGWFWTSSTSYPYIWQEDENSYSYLIISSTEKTRVYNYSKGNIKILNVVSVAAIPSLYFPSTKYLSGDLARVGANSYRAVSASTGQDPSNSNSFWSDLSTNFPPDPFPSLSQTVVNAILPTNTPEFFSLTIHSDTGGQVMMGLDANSSLISTSTSSFSRIFEKDTSITVTAVPLLGYNFVDWSDGASTNSPEITILLSVEKTFTARFDKDLLDSDNDGLTNYDESNIHFTLYDSNDSDSDGFSDSFEVELGTNPLVSDSALIEHISSNPSEFSLVTKAKYDEAMASYPAQESNATPYTNDWFYVPERGWLWTNKSTFPYLFDSNSSDWLHFESGNDIPTFYEYKTKSWVRFE